MLDAHQLNIFLKAAELENFSQAGRQLNLSQPSVSAHIQSLERHFETRLFHRSGRHISLTEAGEALLPLARTMVRLSIQIEETMASLGESVVGELRLGCSTAVGKYTLPRLIAQFRAENPRVRVHCGVQGRQESLDALLDGRLHLILTSARERFHEIEYSFFTIDPLILIAPADHPWAKRGEIEVQELLTEEFGLREERSGNYTVLEEGLANHGMQVNQLKTAMVLGNSEGLRAAVEENLGVAFVSRLVAADGIALGRIKEVKVKNLDLKRRLYFGRNPRLPATKAQAAFWEFIHDPAHEALLVTGDKK
jgi:DNA-binding transcriptional LysR family regulator